ncbi:MAG: hypothetical protein JOZ39_13295, partial [Chloroflexi bacterium]|nr:hypothetical protein [Chloroflexota bacterium]
YRLDVGPDGTITDPSRTLKLQPVSGSQDVDGLEVSVSGKTTTGRLVDDVLYYDLSYGRWYPDDYARETATDPSAEGTPVDGNPSDSFPDGNRLLVTSG